MKYEFVIEDVDSSCIDKVQLTLLPLFELNILGSHKYFLDLKLSNPIRVAF